MFACWFLFFFFFLCFIWLFGRREVASLPLGEVAGDVCLGFFCFLLFRASPMAYEVPRLGVGSELQLPARTTATATRDPSLVRPTPTLTATLDP